MLAVDTFDSLVLGSATLEDAGYYSPSRKLSRGFSSAGKAAETGPQPGLLHQMAVCLPFETIYTHGDLGIIEKARNQVYKEYKETGPTVIQLPIKAQESPVVANGHHPGRLLIASVDKEYDIGALDELLADCKRNNAAFQAYAAAKESLGNDIIKKHGVITLEQTWEDYLDSPEFRGYYRQRLARLFKEQRRWPRVPDFTGRDRESADLAAAVRRFSYVQVSGGPGVGKSALLAKMVDNNPTGQTVVWIQAASRFINKAEIILSMAIQLGLLTSPKVLEEENLKEYLPKLEKDIDGRLRKDGALVVFDSLDPFLNQGWNAFKNKELEDMLSGWVAGGRGMGKARLVFTADLRMKDPDPFKELKNSFARVVSRREQKLFLRPLDPGVRKELFLKWLQPISGEQGFRQWSERLFNVGGNNLRLLRLLAFWVCQAKGISKIEENIREVEGARPWEKENLVYRYLFKTIGAQKEAILKTLEWVGRPVLRTVLCSSAGMKEALEQLLDEGLLIANRGDTIELVYRFGKEEFGRKADLSGPTAEEAIGREIRAFRRLGDIVGNNTAQAVDYFAAGNSVVEVTGQWKEWADAPIINLSGFLAKAQYLLKQAKKITASPSERQTLAGLAVNLCKKSIEAGIEPDQGYFIYAQAMEILYPHSEEDTINRHYEQSIALKPRSDKYNRYAIFTYKRLKHFERAETLFKEARQLEEKRKHFDILGLHAQAELYLHWEGHEKEAGAILNRVIGSDKNKLQNLFLAGRLFHKLYWKFLTVFFFEACLTLDKEHIQVLNTYAEACEQWGDENKAKELFEKALKINDNDIKTLNSYANAYVQWRDEEKSKELFEKALKIQPDNVQVLNSYANACVQWGDEKKAKELFEKALELQPDNVQVLNSYANACVLWGDGEKAKELFEKALKLQPDNVQVLNSYANACVQWDDKEKAIKLLEKSISIEPKNIPTLDIYRKAREKWGEKEIEIKIEKEPEPLPGTKEHIPSSKPVPSMMETAPVLIISPTPGPKTPTTFAFTSDEKAWLISFTGNKQTWTGAKKWAGFGMLYTLYYLKGELHSTASLGWIPSLEREYRRLYNTVNDLHHIMQKATHEPQEPHEPHEPALPIRREPILYWSQEWFNKEGNPFDLIAYYDDRMLHYPQNPVCAAFLCQALEAYGWDQIAAQFRKEASQWLKTGQETWQPFMNRNAVNLFTPTGKEKFLNFLKELTTPRETESPTGNVEPVTEKAVANLIGRFSVTWEKMPHHFPWQQLTPDEETRALCKLLELIAKLEKLLDNIITNQENAFDHLKTFVAEDLIIPTSLMKRLYRHTAELEKHEPIPWYVSGEIIAIKEAALLVNIERASASPDEDQKREIPLTNFPAANPQVGQRFFAKIDPDKPETVYDIEPLEYRQRTFDEIFISLFGRDIYDKAAAHWEKEDEHA